MQMNTCSQVVKMFALKVINPLYFLMLLHSVDLSEAVDIPFQGMNIIQILMLGSQQKYMLSNISNTYIPIVIHILDIFVMNGTYY